MKIKHRITGIVLAMIFILSSCAPFSTSIDKLAVAPLLISSQKEIVSALKKYAKSDITLKYPERGNSSSAFINYDVDLDGSDEVIAFYSTAELTKVNIAVLDSKDRKWSCVCSIEGEGTKLYKADLIDFTDRQETELAVGYSDGDRRVFGVYNLKSGEKLCGGDFSEYEVLSYGDGIKDRLITVGSESVAVSGTYSQTVSCYYEENGIINDATLHLPSSNRVYQQLKCVVRPDFSALIYVDSLSGEIYSTEIFSFLNDELKSVYPMSSDRRIKVLCTDIDGDGLPEIPTEYHTGNKEETIENIPIIKWYSVVDDKLETSMETVVNVGMGYYLSIPGEWSGRVYFRPTDDGNGIVSYISTGDTGKEFFTVKATNKYSSQDMSGYTKISENGSVYFYAKINSSMSVIDESLVITYDGLGSRLGIL